MAEASKTPQKTTAQPTKPVDATPAGVLEDQPAVVVSGAPDGATPAPTTGDVPDPRVESDEFQEGDQAGFAGQHGFDLLDGNQANVQYVDPKNIRADVTPGVQPNSGGDELLAAAQEKAPNLTAEFVRAYGLTDANLADIANGAVPPPPAIGPAHTSDLYLTPGGWQQTPPGISPDAYATAQTERSRR